MELKKLLEETARELKVDTSELGYVTDEYIVEMDSAKEEDDETEYETLESGEKIRGVYCNSLTYDPGTGGYIRYKRGKKGTTNYGCGNDPYRKGKSGTTVKQINPSCSGGRKQYLVTW